jgi:hypothetical protein
LIGQLYAIERELPGLLGPSDEAAKQEQRRQREEQRQEQRQQQSQPILGELKKWLDDHKGQALPKTPLGKAIGYALNNWEALCRYVEAGYLAIDNNLSERTLRAMALGRNNWGVIGSEAGGQTAAVLYTLVGTCKHLLIDPFVYLREALPGLFALGEKPNAEQLAAWLPDRWLLKRGRDSPREEASAGRGAKLPASSPLIHVGPRADSLCSPSTSRSAGVFRARLGECLAVAALGAVGDFVRSGRGRAGDNLGPGGPVPGAIRARPIRGASGGGASRNGPASGAG